MILLFVGSGSDSSTDIDIVLVGSLVIIFGLLVIARYYLVNRKRLSQVSKKSLFHRQLRLWSEEISDKSVKKDFVEIFYNFDKIYGDDFNYHEEKMKIYQNWGNHIASLRQEIRDDKLNSIIKKSLFKRLYEFKVKR